MAFRQIIKGTIGWDRLLSVICEFARRNELDELRVEFLEADNWLSTPCVINDRWFVKIISEQHLLVHTLLTVGRNLGAVSSGRPGFFEHVNSPIEMAEMEFEAICRMRTTGVNAPEPIETFEHDGLAVLVVEYLPAFRTLSGLDGPTVERFAPDLFASLFRMHEMELAHGDLRSENVLIADEDLYLIDATRVRKDQEGTIEAARAYDLACALAVLEPHVGARTAIAVGHSQYPVADLLAARDFLDFVNMRPDHSFNAASLKGEIEKTAADIGRT